MLAAAGASSPAELERVSERTRMRTASFSVAAACFLVTVKLVAGLITGSLGLLAEAAHSGTDLVAALLTLLALRVAMRPADREHQYGHGKAEHLAALGESAFLALVSTIIGFESLRRLLAGESPEIDAHWWVLVLLGVVIAIDASRAVISLRVSRRFGSVALEANALHFASDLVGSVAVLVGLVLVRAGYDSADSVAALLVAVLVIVAAWRLGSRSVAVLMDRTARDSQETIDLALAGLGPGVQIRRVRSRSAAGLHFVDLVVAVAPDAALRQAHATADQIEAAVREVLPNTDVMIHVEPLDLEAGLRERVTAAALGVPEVREVHNVRVMHVGDGFEVTLHAKVPPDQTLEDAHGTVARVEASIAAAVPEIGRAYTHIEPLARLDWARKPLRDEVREDRLAIDEIVRRYTGADAQEVRFRDTERGRIAFITVVLPGEQPLRVAHGRAGSIEHDIRQRRRDLADVVVHTEPGGAVAEGRS